MSIQDKLKHELKAIILVTLFFAAWLGIFMASRCVGTLVLLILALPCHAQDIEPRRWSHLPLGGNFAGVAYAYTAGDIFFNPVQRNSEH